MEPSSSRSDRVLLDELQQRRAQLRESMDALEGALAAPSAGNPARWRQRVHVALVELDGDFRQHIEITEGAEGIHQDLLATSPRLSGPVATLTAEHAEIRRDLDALVSGLAEPDEEPDVAVVREAATLLLGRLVRHRQRGSDLVFEAYEFEIGGET